eukprot:gene7124-biopygen4385
MASGDGARPRAPHPVPQKSQEHAVRVVRAEHRVGHSGDRSKDRAAEEVATFDLGQGARGLRGSHAGPPLYDRVTGVRLSAYPEWNAAVRTVKRLEREMDPDPPEPITFGQYTSAVKGLRRFSPRAALFLSMMWAMASRAGDISGLRQKDVTLATSVRPDGTVAVGVEQKVGKGTRFRGTYWPASTLLQEEAAELRRAMSLVSPNQRLFRDHEILKDHIRKALHRENRASALPSVRKGAVRHLAQQGVSEGDLMRLMGHKRVETLYRYLGHGLPVTQEAVAAQDAAARVHRPPPSTSATRLPP